MRPSEKQSLTGFRKITPAQNLMIMFPCGLVLEICCIMIKI